MKTFILVVCLIFLLSGCGRYGEGVSNGYVYAVEEGRVYDCLFIKSSLESSETDAYAIRKDSGLMEKTRGLLFKKVEINYSKNAALFNNCNGGVNDLLKNISEIK